jgi:hypothetical protein
MLHGVAPQVLIVLAGSILAIGNRGISCREGELQIQALTDGHGEAIAEAYAPVLALMADASTKLKVPLARLGIKAQEVTHQLVSPHAFLATQTWLGLEPPATFCA